MLSSDTVLTAAHCKKSTSTFKASRILKYNLKVKLIQVVVGELDVTENDGTEQRITPRYDHTIRIHL